MQKETLGKIRALYLHDLDHGTRAEQYQAADKLLALARFERGEAKAIEKALAQEEKAQQPAGPTVEQAQEVLSGVTAYSAENTSVRAHPRDYRHILGLGALHPINHKKLFEAGLLSKDGRRAHPNLMTAWQHTRPSG